MAPEANEDEATMTTTISPVSRLSMIPVPGARLTMPPASLRSRPSCTVLRDFAKLPERSASPRADIVRTRFLTASGYLMER